MSPHALRRWFARHPASWVLGVVLGLAMTLSGAQTIAACHEMSHLLAGAASTGQDGHDAHGAGSHDCPTCLLAAALGGAATAPPALSPVPPDAAMAAPLAVPHEFTPRVACAYASRAPPREGVTSA